MVCGNHGRHAGVTQPPDVIAGLNPLQRIQPAEAAATELMHFEVEENARSRVLDGHLLYDEEGRSCERSMTARPRSTSISPERRYRGWRDSGVAAGDGLP